MSEVFAHGRLAEILLVEDNDNDFELTRLGFKAAKLALNLHRVRNGEECMDFLRKQGKYTKAPTPDLILLDLNMPRMDGREVLAEVASDERLKQLPIIILTTSDSDSDILQAYKLRCSSYIVKPVDFAKFAQVVKSIADYWFSVVVLPPK